MEKAIILKEEMSEQLLKAILSSGLAPVASSQPEKVLEALDGGNYALLLVDIMLPGGNGCEMISRVREAGLRIPMIALGGTEKDALKALENGADIWVPEEAGSRLLALQAKALVRRAKQCVGNVVVSVGPFEYNSSTLHLTKNGQDISLSAKENAMVKVFLDNVGKVFTEEKLYSLVWSEPVIDENAIMVYINRLRRKIEDDPRHPHYIQNVRGEGYRFVI